MTDEERVLVFAVGRCYHMPYTEQMPGTGIPLAERMTVCTSAIGLSASKKWAVGHLLRPCRHCYGPAALGEDT